MPHLATNQYPWMTFHRREGRAFGADPDAEFAEIAGTGLNGFEPIATSPEQVAAMAPQLERHGLEMRSLYVNSALHDDTEAEKSVAEVLAIASEARRVGARIIVTNPSPIRWGGPESKSDAELETQAAALDRLGRELGELGLVLAYHNHDIELRHAAREFHHMMVGTSPQHVALCLDSHWIFRGAGDSFVAVQDVVQLYGERVAELHLRQSVDGVWQETFGPGDIDYAWIAQRLHSLGIRPHLVLEQAVEGTSPHTRNAADAHHASCEFARRLFADSD